MTILTIKKDNYLIGEKSACVSSNSAPVVADCYRLSVRKSHTEIIRQVDVVQRDIVAVDAKGSSEVIASSTSSERGVVDDVDCVLVEVHDIPCIPINLWRGTLSIAEPQEYNIHTVTGPGRDMLTCS